LARIGSSSTLVIETNLSMFMLSVMIGLPGSGLIRSGCRAAEGFSRTEIGRIQKMIGEHQTQLKEAWNDYFRS
jgi:flagellar motor switch protein FliM